MKMSVPQNATLPDINMRILNPLLKEFESRRAALGNYAPDNPTASTTDLEALSQTFSVGFTHSLVLFKDCFS